jgi:hypothetical protein
MLGSDLLPALSFLLVERISIGALSKVAQNGPVPAEQMLQSVRHRNGSFQKCAEVGEPDQSYRTISNLVLVSDG